MTAADRPPLRIAVFGEPYALWPAAAALSADLPPHATLILVEERASDDGPSGLTLPCNSAFHQRLGVDMPALAGTGGARFGLGVDLLGWQGEDSQFFAAPSGTLPKINDIELHQIMLRAAMAQGQPDRLAYLLRPFRFAARAAMAGKFAFPPDDPGSPLQLLGPTMQIARSAYADALKPMVGEAEQLTSDAAEVDLAEDGAIQSVKLADGQELAADLYIDLSGTLSALAPEDSRPDSVSLSSYLPFDRIARRLIEGESGPDPGCTAARARPGGVLIETPVGGALIRDYWHSSDACDEDALLEIMGGTFESTAVAAGHCEAPWTGNLVRLGAASARLGPLHAADMLLLQEQLVDLVGLLPAGAAMDVEARAFNARHGAIVRQLRDFLLLPMLLNGRDEALWKTVASRTPPETLAIRLEQFRSRGRFVSFDRELFDRQTWIDLMIGFGIVPERYDPLTDAFDMKRLPPVLKRMADAFSQAIAAMPPADGAAR